MILLAALTPVLGFSGFSGALLVAAVTSPILQVLVAVIGAFGAMAAGGLSLFGELKKMRFEAAQNDARTELKLESLEFKIETAIRSADKAVSLGSKVDRRMDDLYQWWIDRKEGTDG